MCVGPIGNEDSLEKPDIKLFAAVERAKTSCIDKIIETLPIFISWSTE
jgi:hypothetical protein